MHLVIVMLVRWEICLSKHVQALVRGLLHLIYYAAFIDIAFSHLNNE